MKEKNKIKVTGIKISPELGAFSLLNESKHQQRLAAQKRGR
jgi:hypothetical protein